MTFLSTMTTFPEFPDLPEETVLSVNNPSHFDLPVNQKTLETILQLIQKGENVTFQLVELVYVDEKEIVEINKKYLQRDYVTDIISFNYNDDAEPSDSSKKSIEGTLYCCAPRIEEQSYEMDSDPEQEFYRIFVHGLLHLAGYEDSSADEKETMTKLENHYLEQMDN
ncbi:MAG: rRNA maturation RNase YbeY [Balneolaceae bacterium]|nr:rRNA maturation RNase YbeY [Balneolaceae bacterium]